MMNARKIVSAVAFMATSVAAWDECHFPHEDFIAHDEGVGKSAACAPSA